MFSPLARGKAGWDGGLEFEDGLDHTVRQKLLFSFRVSFCFEMIIQSMPKSACTMKLVWFCLA